MVLPRSIRTNCPAHIMLRASKDGTKLEVTSVNNEHNHEISEVNDNNEITNCIPLYLTCIFH